ncbi:LPP20 family lipoprotein [Aquaspirillum serpens]|uniref:LPP20 family lipoprotein n=1 Tax=Aquaspirillum serpens TaxID=190 RepID=UPI000415384B|nr:LPP20 family lipoprotein [Aquaspirillum serpens]
MNAYKPIKIGVVGYGARPTTKGLSATQRHLLGMRAAKLDAYRAIAEQVQGLRLVGNSTVEAMAVKHDGFRTYVDAYLRGVNVVSTSKNRDGSYEARAEIEIDRDFYRQFLMAYQSMQDNTVKKTSAAPVKGNYYIAH